MTQTNKPRSVCGTHDEKTLAQFDACLSHPLALGGALMADGHLGYIMPVGGVVAYFNAVSVSGVGFDIGCGNLALRTEKNLRDFSKVSLSDLADEIQATISFGIGRNNNDTSAVESTDLFEDPAWGIIPREHRQSLFDRARNQLGTVGSGNHYVDILADTETGDLWVGVHFGSRGFGHWVASSFLSLAAGSGWGDRVPEFEAVLPLDTQLGRDYWTLMELAGRYAYAGRDWVAEKVASLFSNKINKYVHNHHNFAWREDQPISDMDVIVVRKGATPAFPGQQGFVGGSMGDCAVILQGALPSQQSGNLLFSTVHGAGRVMSRNEARGKVHRKSGRVISEGKISQGDMNEWLSNFGVILRGGGRDEAPQAYRRLPDVLDAQGRTIKILHTLKPVVVVMAGENEFDPYKD